MKSSEERCYMKCKDYFLRVRWEALGISIQGRGGARPAFLHGPFLDSPLPLGVPASSVPLVLPLRLQGGMPDWLSNTADVGCFCTGDFFPLRIESPEPISVVLPVLLDSSSSAVWKADLRS